jgi:hypothetical protein
MNAKPLPCPVCHRRATLDATYCDEPKVTCCDMATHDLIVYGKTPALAIRRWNRLAGGHR